MGFEKLEDVIKKEGKSEDKAATLADAKEGADGNRDLGKSK